MNNDERKELLISNDLDWYVVDYTDGDTKLMHATSLSSILECGGNLKDYNIEDMEQCWNGENLDY